MKAKFTITLTTEELVERLLDTGVTEWVGSDFVKVFHYKDGDRVLIRMNIERDGRINRHEQMVEGAVLHQAFNEFVHSMSFTVTDGELDDLDFDAAVADEILQTAVFGEVVYA